MANDEGLRKILDKGKVERLTKLGKSNVSTTDKIIYEILRSWYPDLSEMEMLICKWTFYTMWDLHSGNSAMYDELSIRLLKNENFANEKEIENVIKSLVSKFVVEVKEEEWVFGIRNPSIETLKVLTFTQENLCNELHNAYSEYVFN